MYMETFALENFEIMFFISGNTCIVFQQLELEFSFFFFLIIIIIILNFLDK